MPRLSLWIIRTSLLYLGTGITFGALMLWNKGLPFEGAIWLLRMPHIEITLLGWTMQLAMGTAAWILPRHTQEPKYGHERLAWTSYIFLNAGILSSISAAWLGNTPAIVGHLCEMVGAVLFVIFIWPRVKAFGV